jgi:hypothetical protein
MSTCARITPIWKKQKLFLSILLLFFGGYFFLDGAVLWPRTNERFLKHKEFADKDDLAGWDAYAKTRGWSSKPPEKLHTAADITGQFLFGSLCVGGGLIALVYWSVQSRRRIEIDDTALITPNGKRVPFEAITGLGLKRWESKGLATVRYELSGRRCEFTIDDYKFEAEPSRAIVDELKRQLESRAKTAAQDLP